MLRPAAENVELTVTINILHFRDNRMKRHTFPTFITSHDPGLLDAGHFGPILDLEHIDTNDLAPLVFTDCKLAFRKKMHIERRVLVTLFNFSKWIVLLGIERLLYEPA